MLQRTRYLSGLITAKDRLLSVDKDYMKKAIRTAADPVAAAAAAPGKFGFGGGGEVLGGHGKMGESKGVGSDWNDMGF